MLADEPATAAPPVRPTYSEPLARQDKPRKPKSRR